MDDIKLYRYSTSKIDTLGILLIKNRFLGYILEDEFRDVKVKGDTRIKSGRYRLVINKSESPLTLSYRKRFDWFKYHIMVENVPEFSNVYIHVGNTEKDTEGCLLIGDTANNNTVKQGFIGESVPAFERFYKEFYPIIEKGDNIYISIYDSIW